MAMTISYKNKNVVIVGGTSGINLGVAEGFAREGAALVVISRKQEKVDAAVGHLLSLGAPQVLGFTADVRDVARLQQVMEEAAQHLGKFDVVVSGAAGNFPALAMSMSANAFKSVIDIDLLGTFHVMQSIYPHLNKPGAVVINISAPQAIIPMVGQSHVCAAKAGVDMITKSLCLEWGAEGIRINSIIPGPIEGTEGMSRLAPTSELQAGVKKTVPLQRFGQTSDIANACLFLASDYASFISGAILPVDGGWSQGGVAVMGSKMAGMLEK